MKEARYSAVGSSSSASSSSSAEVADGVAEVAGNVITKFWNPKLPQHFNAGLVSVGIVSLMVVMQIRDSLNNGLLEDFKKMIHPVNPPEEVEMPQQWNPSSHQFLPMISDWDEQRVRWIEGDPNLKMWPGQRPRVLMVSGSSQEEGELYILSHLLLRAGKNKQDYTQMHDIQFHYNMMNPDPEFSDWWVKLPVIRMLMLRHPEVEWVWWLDADQVITDMTFELSFEALDQFNLVLYGESKRIRHGNWDPNALDPSSVSTGNLLIRNCQWSLDFLGAWAHKGTQNTTEAQGRGEEFQETTEDDENVVFVSGNEHDSFVALLAEDMRHPLVQQKWVPNVKLVEETEYTLNGNWTHIAPRLEELGEDGDHRVPFITHFDGCLPHPAEVPQLSRRDSENFVACVHQLGRAFDFAENQVYRELGLERNVIGNSSAPFVWKDTPTDESAETALRILPIVTGWDEKRRAYMESRPWTRKDQVVILSGSKPTPCEAKEGAHILVRGLKNKIDYTRKHGTRMFYNMAVIHKNLNGWWSKIPALKLMMINSVDVEWIWWTDSDALFTKMDFEPSFDRYNANGYNLIMFGIDHDVFDLKKYNGLNTGDMFIRNCQWSLDLLDKWASLADTKVDFLDSFLDRPEFLADDQSLLVYLLVTEREKWASKVFFENDGTVVLSGEWEYWTDLYVDEYKMRHDLRPAMTHFAGCHFCNTALGVGFNLCLERYDRAYNFADNQMLETYGLRHERLNSSRIISGSVDDRKEWTHLEIERMIGKSSEELSPAAKGKYTPKSKEEEKLDTAKEEEVTTSSKEEENLDTTKEEGTTSSMEEEKVEITNEGEVATNSEEQVKLDSTKDLAEEEENLDTTEDTTNEGITSALEEENVDTTKETEEEVPQTEAEEEKVDTTEEEVVDTSQEQEEVPQTEEEVVDTPQEQEEVPQTEEEVVDTPKKQEEVPETKEGKQTKDTTEEHDEVLQTEEEVSKPKKKKNKKHIPRVEKPSELSHEIPENEALKDADLETNKEENVDETEESQMRKETLDEKVVPDQSQEEQEEPTESAEETLEPQENLSTSVFNDGSSRLTDP